MDLCKRKTEAFVKKQLMGIGTFFPGTLAYEAMIFSCRYINFPTFSGTKLAAIAIALTILPRNTSTIIKVDNLGTINAIKKFMSKLSNNRLKSKLANQHLLFIIVSSINTKNLDVKFKIIKSKDNYNHHAYADFALKLAHDSDIKIIID